MKSPAYYLERATHMLELAEKATSEESQRGFIKAARAYQALAETASRFGSRNPASEKE